ncbi:MAG: alpha/beta hydrolase [Prevotella sp.]|nr:alpha/beta hydrolase [Prevotella sp.]
MKKLKTLILMLFVAATAMAQKGTDIALWPEGAPNDNGNEREKAKVTVFLPEARRATGRAIVICPGGGYSHLAWEKEGTAWAPFFNQQGIAVIVLKYRMPNGHLEVPISDAEEAIRLVRRNAAQWNVKPNDIGIMGFSAGGHLASTIATHSKGDAKPNFQILFYPVITMEPGITHQGSHDLLLGKKPKKKLEREYSNDQQVTRATPRAFIVLSDDDNVVLPANGVSYYLECYRHDVPATLHVYPTGGHGWGILQSFDYHFEMMGELKAWLRSF